MGISFRNALLVGQLFPQNKCPLALPQVGTYVKNTVPLGHHHKANFIIIWQTISSVLGRHLIQEIPSQQMKVHFKKWNIRQMFHLFFSSISVHAVHWVSSSSRQGVPKISAPHLPLKGGAQVSTYFTNTSLLGHYPTHDMKLFSDPSRNWSAFMRLKANWKFWKGLKVDLSSARRIAWKHWLNESRLMNCTHIL